MSGTTSPARVRPVRNHPSAAVAGARPIPGAGEVVPRLRLVAGGAGRGARPVAGAWSPRGRGAGRRLRPTRRGWVLLLVVAAACSYGAGLMTAVWL